MQDKLTLIKKANECDVLMTLLCQILGLEPAKTTHTVFVERFTEVQKKSLEYQGELREMYLSTTQQKLVKRRKAKFIESNGEITPPPTQDEYRKALDEIG